MKRRTVTDAEKALRQKSRWRLWQRAALGLAAMLAFCAVYGLILPGVSMEKEPVCGMEPHTHSETCYTTQTELICALPECPAHTHGPECYAVEQRLTCTEDHEHSPECSEQVLACGMEETEGHTHGDECYETEEILICGEEEHVHSETCYPVEEPVLPSAEETPVLSSAEEPVSSGMEEPAPSDEEEIVSSGVEEDTAEEGSRFEDPAEAEPEPDLHADVECRADWEATLRGVALTGDWSRDVLAIAESQLGYAESSRNYTVDEAGNRRGYTRYGAWYGDPYGDWCAMFASFCISYAGVEGFPLEANCGAWIKALEARGLYHQAGTYMPESGSLVFFDWDDDLDADHVGLVAEVLHAGEDEPERLRTMEGNSGGRVQYVMYALGDARILGYGELPEEPREMDDTTSVNELPEEFPETETAAPAVVEQPIPDTEGDQQKEDTLEDTPEDAAAETALYAVGTDAPEKQEDAVPDTNITVTMAWEPSPPEGTTITMALYRTVEQEAAEPERVAAVTLDGTADLEAVELNGGGTVQEDSGWTAAWSELPAYGGDNAYIYYIRQEPVAGYIPSYSIGGERVTSVRLMVEGKAVNVVKAAAGPQRVTVTLKNTAGAELPQTGGTGTTLYIITGLLLMAACLLYCGRTAYKRKNR